MGWIEIQSDNIPYLVDKQRIAGKLKPFRAMRFQSEGPPDPADGGLAQSSSGRQHAAGPMGSALRGFLQCQSYHPLNLLVADLPRRSRTRIIPSPAMPSTMKRLRHRPTVKPVVRNLPATAALLAPPAHSRTIRARKDAELVLETGYGPLKLRNQEESQTPSRKLFVSFHESKRRTIKGDYVSHRRRGYMPSGGSRLSIRLNQRGIGLRRDRTCERQGRRQDQIRVALLRGPILARLFSCSRLITQREDRVVP